MQCCGFGDRPVVQGYPVARAARGTGGSGGHRLDEGSVLNFCGECCAGARFSFRLAGRRRHRHERGIDRDRSRPPAGRRTGAPPRSRATQAEGFGPNRENAIELLRARERHVERPARYTHF